MRLTNYVVELILPDAPEPSPEIVKKFQRRIDAEIEKALFAGYRAPTETTYYLGGRPRCCNGRILHEPHCVAWLT